MSAGYRFTLLRSSGWSRMGVAAAVVILFATPMLWTLGAFGQGDESVNRALVFLFCGLWLGLTGGYAFGWAIKGFLVKARDDSDDEDSPRRPAMGLGSPPPHAQPGAAKPMAPRAPPR